MTADVRHRLDTRRPFTRSDALGAGISDKVLRGSRFRRIFRDVYIAAEVRQTSEERIDAALLLHPASAFLSHTTAARCHGVAVPASSLVHVSVFRDRDRCWRAGLKPHVAPAGTVVRTLHGRRVSNPVRMFIELAAVLELVDLVVAGDDLLQVFEMSADQLRAALGRTREYWSGTARAAAQHVRDRVDSPMETRLRMLLVLAGLPEPVVNHEVRDRDGVLLFRFDLAYPALRLAIEYDGRHHRDDAGTWERDILRGEAVDASGWRVIRVTSRGIYGDPAETLERIWHGMRRRGRLVPPPKDGWRPHFPGRAGAG